MQILLTQNRQFSFLHYFFFAFVISLNQVYVSTEREPQPVVEPLVQASVAPCLGCVNPVDVNSEKVKNLAKLALPFVNKHLNGHVNLVKVNDAKHQVVAGMKYFLELTVEDDSTNFHRKCHVELLEQVWKQDEDDRLSLISILCEDPYAAPLLEEDAVIQTIEKPSVNLHGWTPEHLATFSLQEKNRLDGKNRVFVEELGITQNHGITEVMFKSGISVCSNTDTDKCRLDVNEPISLCSAYFKWSSEGVWKVEELLCAPIADRRKREAVVAPGGTRNVETEDKDVQEAAQFAVGAIDGQSNGLFAQKLVKVLSSSKQVVAGWLYHLQIEVGTTGCRKSVDMNIMECNINRNHDNKVCTVEVWDQPWLKKKSLKSFSCETSQEHHRTKKDTNILGGDDHDYIHIGVFEDFMKQYNKSYKDDDEYRYRYSVFRSNMKKVRLLQQTEMGTAVYGATMFADLTESEFRRNYLGFRPHLRSDDHSHVRQAEIPSLDLPGSFDWRQHGAVTPVKNQGMCGSCWAFSVTGNIEGQWYQKSQNLLSLSEQELVDCDSLDKGCSGGLPENAYKSIMKLGGLETETDYPYDGRNEKCHFQKPKARVYINSSVEISKNETEIAQWLIKNGPISIGINANAMQFYFGGVSHPLKFLCSPKSLDHGVLIVGFGVHTTRFLHRVQPYWLIKNSWGTGWGEKGYYRVYRGDGTCGVNQMATSAIIL